MQTNEKIQITKDQVISTAEQMRSEGRLLTMIHGHLEKDGTPVVTYDQAAAWAEREINELMAISFEGLDCSQRLFLPDNLLDGRGQIIVTPLSELREKNGL